MAHRGRIIGILALLGLGCTLYLSLPTPAGQSLRVRVTSSPDQLNMRPSLSGASRIDLEGASLVPDEVGRLLPEKVVWVDIPTGYSATLVNAKPLSWQDYPGTRPLRVDSAAPDEPLARDVLADSPRRSGGQGVGEVKAVLWHGRMRGEDFWAVRLRPVAVLDDEESLRLYTDIEVELTLQPAARTQGDAFRVERESQAGRETQRWLRSSRGFAPPSKQDDSYRPGESAWKYLTPLINSGLPVAPTFRPTVDGSPVEMVIITDSTQAPAYEHLAEIKTQLGVPTVVRTVEWIRDNYLDQFDTQATIRAFIKDAASKWGTVYVLLGGDTEVVPVRIVHPNSWDDAGFESDYYYSDLDGNWDSDGDALFGEMYWYEGYGDTLDLLPDVFVGRLPSHDADDAEQMIDKILTYTTSPPSNFARTILLLGEVITPSDFTPGDSVWQDGAELCQDILDHYAPLPFVMGSKRLYENSAAWTGSYPESLESVVAEINNNGYNIIHHVGHGAENVMSVGLNYSTLRNSDVEGLTNGSRQGIVYAATCGAAGIETNCIAEAWLANTGGGAVGVVASSHRNWVYPGWLYQQAWYDCLFSGGGGHIGRISAEARIPISPDAQHWSASLETVLGQECLADPEMWIWTDTPGSLEIAAASTFTLGGGVYSVTVTSGQVPVDSARVCLWKAGDAYSVVWTDVNGEVSLPFDPDSTGGFSIGAWAPNYIAAVDSATVVAPPSTPYLFPASRVIDDDTSGGTEGNGDGRVDAGETVDLAFSLKNNGGTTETGISAVLASTDAWVSIADSLCQYPDIPAGQTRAPSDAFRVTIARAAPDRSEVHCSLTVTGSGGSYAKDVVLYVHAPVFGDYQQSIPDTIIVDQTFTVFPSIQNSGLGTARGVELRLRSSDQAVTVSDSVIVIGDVAAGAVGASPSDSFAVELSDISSYHDLRVVVLDEYAEVYSKRIDWTRPPTPEHLRASGDAGSITVTWDPVDAQDLRGYSLLRATSIEGPFSRVGEARDDRIAYYRDEGLGSMTRYFYAVTAQDSSGNESDTSAVVSATTTLPLHEGFPVTVESPTSGGVTLADLDGDEALEILTGGQEIYALRANGDEYIDGDHDVRYTGPFSDTRWNGFWNTPAVGDVDRDGHLEVAAASWNPPMLYVWDYQSNVLSGFPKDLNPGGYYEPNAIGSVAMADIDADGDLEVFVQCVDMLFAWHHNGDEVLDGDSDANTDGVFKVFGASYNYGTPSFADLDRDGYREIIAPSRDDSLYVMRRNGANLPGFPLYAGGNITSSPAIADIDHDGREEIVFASSAPQGGQKPMGLATSVWAASPNGLNPPPSRGSAQVLSPKITLHLTAATSKNACALGNISSCGDAVVDGDLNTGYNGYVLATRYNLDYGLSGVEFGISYNGTQAAGADIFSWTTCAWQSYPTTGWPTSSGTGNRIVWDAGGSNSETGCQTDSVAVAGFFYVYAYSSDILSLTVHPSSGQASIANCSAQTLVLEDSDLGSAGFGAYSGQNPCEETPATGGLLHALHVSLTEPPGWPIPLDFSADIDASPAIGDVNNDGDLDVVVGTGDGQLVAVRGRDGTTLPGFPRTILDASGDPAPVRSSPVLADIDDDGDLEIFFGDQSGQLHGLTSAGSDLAGFPIQTGNALEGTPAVYDVDDDGMAEVIAYGFDQTIRMWDLDGSFSEDAAPWPMFKRGGVHTGRVGDGLGDDATGVPGGQETTRESLIRVNVGPNPFRTALRVYVAASVNLSAGSPCELAILRVDGRLVRTYSQLLPRTGVTEFQWDGRDGTGRVLPTGLYYWRVRTADRMESGRCVLLR